MRWLAFMRSCIDLYIFGIMAFKVCGQDNRDDRDDRGTGVGNETHGP